jgi:hypothetical protein
MRKRVKPTAERGSRGTKAASNPVHRGAASKPVTGAMSQPVSQQPVVVGPDATREPTASMQPPSRTPVQPSPDIKVADSRRTTASTGLALAKPGDRAEREAEQVSEHLLQSDGAERGPPPTAGRLRPLATSSHADTPAARALHQELEQGADCGRPLPSELRERFGPQLGYDLADVRIHSDERAARTAARLNANAFTYGRHLVFGRGRYQPDSAPGRRLLAHELAHVVQQLGRGSGQAIVQRDGPTGTVETSEGVQEIEGEVVSSSASQINQRLQIGQARINTQIDEWARENFNHVASSLETAAESFENWYAAHSSSSSSSFVYDVVTAGLSVLSAAYPPAGLAAAVLGGVLSVTRSAANARDAARRQARGSAALLVEQAMINKARALRSSSANFGSRLKARGEAGDRVWSAVGIALTMGDPNMIPIAKQELYQGARMPALDRDFTEPALTGMILTYMHWERISSMQSAILFTSSRDIEWMILNDAQRRQRAAAQARRQLELSDESLR